jgi:hypothetical protein
MKPIQVGLLGIGTVGSGTFNVLQRNQEEIRAVPAAASRSPWWPTWTWSAPAIVGPGVRW